MPSTISGIVFVSGSTFTQGSIRPRFSVFPNSRDTQLLVTEVLPIATWEKQTDETSSPPAISIDFIVFYYLSC
ncbi:hypothetical protein [Chryseobacterium taeanense]|uniref:hypothetical protein n=1 Tax=Chryseobacterium taeanense TaxID=311334 RepID=UPI001E2E5784|nr:hypothetical protein [Chryseobacterium taeanense]